MKEVSELVLQDFNEDTPRKFQKRHTIVDFKEHIKPLLEEKSKQKKPPPPPSPPKKSDKLEEIYYTLDRREESVEKSPRPPQGGDRIKLKAYKSPFNTDIEPSIKSPKGTLPKLLHNTSNIEQRKGDGVYALPTSTGTRTGGGMNHKLTKHQKNSKSAVYSPLYSPNSSYSGRNNKRPGQLALNKFEKGAPPPLTFTPKSGKSIIDKSKDNIKNYMLNPRCKSTLEISQQMPKYRQYGDKDLKKFQYFYETMLMTQKKKDEVLVLTLEENRILREDMNKLKLGLGQKENTIEQLKRKIEQLSETILNLKEQMRESYSLGNNSPGNKQNHQQRFSIMELPPSLKFKKSIKPKQNAGQPKEIQTSISIGTDSNIKTNNRNMKDKTYNNKLATENLIGQRRKADDLFNASMFLDPMGRINVLNFSMENLNDIQEEERFLSLRLLCENSELMQEMVLNSDKYQLEEMRLTIKCLYTDQQILLNVVDKLRTIMVNHNSLTNMSSVTESIEDTAKLVCSVLECDRATVFLLDESGNELWSKVSLGSETIRISLSQGIAGHVVTTGKTVNAQEAYKDPHFDPLTDKKNNYHTKNILCIPLLDHFGNTIGCIQALNKTQGTFTPDDEWILKALGAQAAYFIRTVMEKSKENILPVRLRETLSSAIKLLGHSSNKSLFVEAERQMMTIFNITDARVFFHEAVTDRLLRFKQDKEQPETFHVAGIVGESIKKKCIIKEANAYSSHYYNELVDIDTALPVIAAPVISNNNIFAVIEFINPRGIIIKNKVHIDPIDNEVLEYFLKLFAVAIERLFGANVLKLHFARSPSLYTKEQRRTSQLLEIDFANLQARACDAIEEEESIYSSEGIPTQKLDLINISDHELEV